MKSKEFVKLYKKITLIVFSLLTFLLLILINSNAYAAAVDMTLQKGKLNSSKYYHVEQRDLWKNENVYCIDPNRIVYEGDYKVSSSYEVDSKRGKYATDERQGIQAWILSNDGRLGYSRYDLATSTYEQYLKTSVGQHLMWMSMGSPCSRIPYKNFTYNGKTWKQWHYYDTNGNDQGYQGGTIIQEKNGVRQWGTLPYNVEDEWKKIVGDKNDSENTPGYLNLLNYFRKRTKIEKKNSDKVKVEYDVSKTVFKGASFSYESEEVFSNFDWGKNYIIIGPISFNAATGDWLKNIEVDYTKNGKKYYNQTPSKNNDDIKAFERVKSNGGYNIFDEVIKERLEDIQKNTVIYGYSGILDYGVIYGKNREPEIYLCVKKDVGITSIDNIKITVSRGEIKAWWYELKLSGQQTLLYGDGNVEFNNTSLRFESEALIPPVNLTLNKVNSLDLEGNELYNIPNIPFNIKFEQDGKEIYNKDVTTGKDGKIKIENVMPKNKNDITVTITEKKDIDGDGYKVLSEPLVITLQCSDDGTYWKEKDGAGKLAGGEKYVVNYNTNATIGLTVKLENKSIIEKLTLSKTSSVGGGKVEGAKFKLTLTNIASIKGYKIPTTGTPTIIVTTDKNGNIVLEDIEIADLSKDIVITMEETEAPVGYKKIEGKITVTLKRKGNTYTIHKAEKENTVTDDEFKAGEVTLKNHELKLDIQDIPVMNLGGIVWTEKIQTGKEQPEINNQYDGENQDEALGGVEVRLLDGNNNVIATTTTAKQDGEKVTYLNNLGKEVTVELKQGQYLFTKLNKLNNGTNYIPVRTDYKVEIDYDGITYNALMNTDANILYNKNAYSKITSEDDHGLADGTKTISGTENKEQSTTNGDYTINYTLQDEEKIPDKAIYSNVEKDGDQVFVTARSEKYLQKTEDWESIWKDNNGVGEINLDSYVFDINFGLYKKFFDLNLGTDVDSAEIEINGQKTAYTYDQILDGMLDKDLREKLYKTTDDKVDYNLYLAYSDYYYRIDDYKVPGSTDSLGQPYGEALPGKKDENTELQVYVTYTLQINNQSTQHNATGVKVKYSYDDGYEYVGSNGEATVSDEGHNILTISNINNVVPGEKPKEITLKFKVKKNEDGTFFKAPSDTSKYTNVAEIVEYSTTEGRLVDADSAPGNTFLGENKPTDRREDDTDTANGIVITFKKNAERSISGKVFEDSDKNSTQNGEEQAINDVIVQLIELVEIDGKQQYEYIWQETVAGSNTVKTTDRNGYPGKIYEYKKSDDENPSGKMVEQEINGEAGYCIYVDETNSDGQYKFVNIIPGNYIVRFIYGDGSTYDIRENTLKYNGEDYKSTYVDYNYNAEWYNDTSLNGDNSKAVDNEARRLKVMSYAVDVDGTKGAELALLSKPIGTNNNKLKDVLDNTWMCAETLKIKVPVDPSVLVNENGEKEEKLSITENSTSVKKADSQYKVTFDNVNLGLMERPKTKLVLEKHITGLTVKPVASGVNLIANATADINKILDQGEGDQIQLEGQRDGLSATKSGRTNRGLWYLQTDTTELAQGADAYITYTYVIKNEGEQDYLSASLIEKYREDKDGSYKAYLETLEGIVKEQIKSKGFTKGEYLSGSYYRKNDNAFTPTLVQASVEKLQEALNPKVKFVNSTTDFSKTDRNSNIKYAYYDTNGNMQENDSSINEIITSTKGTGKMELNGRDTSKKLVVSVGLSASEIENGGVYDSYIAQVTHYTNAAGRRDQSTPANLSYVHSEDTGITLDKYNEEDEFWAETVRITKPTGEDKITPVQIAIITISAVAVLGVGIILIKKFVLKK